MIKSYWQVVKPGIVFGNLISAAGGFLLAAGGNLHAGLMAATITGIALVIASACVLNNYLDRDLDRRMSRTRDRVMATGIMSPRAAGIYAAILGSIGMIMLWAMAGRLAASVVFGGFVAYVGAYTLVMKRRSVYAPLVGSLAGAAPPLAGYCAASGYFDTGGVILLLIFALWQLPHFYAIAVYHLDDYLAGAIPVLPATRGVDVTRYHIIACIMAYSVSALMLGYFGYAGKTYMAVAAVSCVIWLGMAVVYRPSEARSWARRLFVYSIVAVCALSITMSLDAVPMATQTQTYALR